VAGSFPSGLGSAWSFSASLLTFVLPMSLFIVVAAVLYVQCSKPRHAPGNWHLALEPYQHGSGTASTPDQAAQDGAAADNAGGAE
jgi:hypothetical protein